ncbi:MAG: portal protein [Candidatus Thorarchaeota archaeon]
MAEIKKLDLYQKLTMLAKMGLPKARTTIKPASLDVPTKEKTKEILRVQFAKVVSDYYLRATAIDPDMYMAFNDFEAMEFVPEISSAMDIYADECLTKNEEGSIIKVKTENTKVKREVENLLFNILDINNNLWAWVRTMCKYGNNYVLLDVNDKKGIVGTLKLPVRQMIREEAYDGNINSVRFKDLILGNFYDAWQVSHFRLLSSNDQRYPYGTSILENIRRTFKQLNLAEDAMLVYRITRAPERRVFMIDVGNIKPEDVHDFIEKARNTMKKSFKINQTQGNRDLYYNHLAVDEDYFIPTRGDKSSRIDTLPGASNLDEISDIEYLQKKLFAGLKIPKAFLTFEEDINAKATLSGQDFRFARTINRVQHAVISELKRICIIHLFAIGYRTIDQLTSFELELTSPNTQLELEKIELLSSKANLASRLWNADGLSFASLVWVLRNIMNFGDNEIKMMLRQQALEGKVNVDIANIGTPEFEKDKSFKSDESAPEPAKESIRRPLQLTEQTLKNIERWVNEMVNESNNNEEEDIDVKSSNTDVITEQSSFDDLMRTSLFVKNKDCSDKIRRYLKYLRSKENKNE